MTESDLTCPWDLLGVSPFESPATIRRAWRALVRSYHPDLARTDREAANRRLAEINAAFDMVCDPEAARRKMAEMRRAEAARRAEASARAARAEEHACKAEEDRRNRAAKAANRMPVIRAASWSRADLLAARAARRAFDRALRVFEDAPASHRPAVYL